MRRSRARARVAVLAVAAHLWFTVRVVLARDHHGQPIIAAAPTSGSPCEPASTEDLVLLGPGRCVDGAGLEPRAFGCDRSASAHCGLVNNSTSACALACLWDDGCTGFEMRRIDGDATAAVCRVFFSYPANANGVLKWALLDNGTQPSTGSQLVVVSASTARTDACCYKHSYPRPCPHDNPLAKPPKQSARAKQIFARMNASAEAASAVALPQVAELVDFCATQGMGPAGPGTLFDVQNCPGLADLTQNGSVAPFPNAAQILQRFVEEMRASEYGHGYAPAYQVGGGVG